MPQLWSVAMYAPDDYSSEPAVFSFKSGSLADAAFVQTAAIIDYQNVAGLRALHCFQKNVDASKMSDRQRRASETLIGVIGRMPGGLIRKGIFNRRAASQSAE